MAGLIALILAGGLYYLTAAPENGQTQKAAKAAMQEVIETAVFNGFDLTLSAPEGACRLHFDKGDISGDVDLTVAPPCRFMRDQQGNPQFHGEGDRQLIAVVGGVLTENPADPLTSRADCGNGMAGVAFSNGSFTATDYTMGPGVYCALMGLEQREIWLFLNG
jgi:hypothetical protein